MTNNLKKYGWNEKEDTIRKNVLIASEPRVEILYREMNSMQF